MRSPLETSSGSWLAVRMRLHRPKSMSLRWPCWEASVSDGSGGERAMARAGSSVGCVHAFTHSFSLSLSLSRARTHTRTHTVSLPLPHTHLVHHDVLGLDVTVHEAVLVQVLDREGDLRDVEAGLRGKGRGEGEGREGEHGREGGREGAREGVGIECGRQYGGRKYGREYGSTGGREYGRTGGREDGGDGREYGPARR